jgi:hypothetical protein
VRDVGHALIGHHAEDVLVDEVADTLDALTARLTAGPVRSRQPNSFQRGDDWGAEPDQTECAHAGRLGSTSVPSKSLYRDVEGRSVNNDDRPNITGRTYDLGRAQ